MMVGSHAKGSAGNEDHLAGLHIIRQPLAVTQIRRQHGGSSATRIPLDATAQTLTVFDDGILPATLDTLSGPLFLALGGEDDAALRQRPLPLRARFRARG
jgi:hypothetical protein